MDTYEKRVQALEAEGMTTSDAQGIADMEEMEEATQHTPGEWASEYCGKNTIKIFKTSDKRRIATVKIKTPRMDEANARLIASAPELLDKLKDVVEDQYSLCVADTEGESGCEHCVITALINRVLKG